MSHSISLCRAERWFYVFLFIHFIAWTLAPTISRFNLPLDSIEGAVWGHQMAWGYEKNPFMNALLTSIAIHIGGTYASVLIYMVCQLSVAICFWSIWQLGKKILPPLYALLGVMLLEGMQYYNLHALDLNDNTLELGLWALCTLFFYRALADNRWRDWICLGIFSGLAMMTKYYSAFLLICLFAFLCVNKKTRQHFKNPAFYAGLVIFLLIITPHVVWLFSHDFITVKYAMGRTDSLPSWKNHFLYPLDFFIQQLAVIIPSCILMLFFWSEKKSVATNSIAVTAFDKSFLYFAGLGPFLLTIIVSLLTGIKLRAGWGQPLLSLWGMLLLIELKPHITLQRFYRFAALFYSLFFLLVFAYSASLIFALRPSSAHFPGKFIAESLTTEWHNTYHQPLRYVAGSRWVSGNVAFYSPDKPSVYINWDNKISFWIDENKLKQNGAIFIWDLSKINAATPDEIKKRFPNLSQPKQLYFPWIKNRNSQPVTIIAAFLPPESK